MRPSGGAGPGPRRKCGHEPSRDNMERPPSDQPKKDSDRPRGHGFVTEVWTPGERDLRGSLYSRESSSVSPGTSLNRSVHSAQALWLLRGLSQPLALLGVEAAPLEEPSKGGVGVGVLAAIRHITASLLIPIEIIIHGSKQNNGWK